MINPFEAIIFDFDGVILDSEPLHYDACCVVFNSIGIKLSYKEYRNDYLGLADKEMFPKLLHNKKYSFSADEISSLIQQKVAAYTEIITTHKNLPVLPNFEQFILELAARNKKMAICSGSTRKEIAVVLSNYKEGKLQPYFEFIVTAEDVQVGKPSPEGYLLTAKHLAISPSSCLVIEDTPHGITAAKRAGMQVIGLCTSYEHHELSNADYIVPNYNYLMNGENIIQY